ncbi:MAG: hypothetical protein A3K10_15715 [Bacteroidetes bacterium RIFCSPLOWO2_12_FULL_31_6]|nr:MAG: hypothetical protein A3K10_15715 [Bacteroidetes bacterium RIFCSPLOWO2_12_FULL_31_6]
MNTGNVNFVRHTYQVSKELKSYTVYQIVEVKNNTNLLTDLIRIEPFLNKSKATNFNDYFRIYNKSSWAKSDLITGLIPTSTKHLFFGDCKKPSLIGNTSKSLLLFYFVPNSNQLIIDVFTDYYPYNDNLLINLLNEFRTN